MIRSLERILAGLDRRWITVISLIGVGIVGLVDYLTGYEISLSILYLGPVGMAAWYADRRVGIAMAVVSAMAWFLADVGPGHAYSHPAIPVWNALVRLGFFLIVAVLLSALHERLRRAQSLALHDPLTGLLNSRGFAERLEYSVALTRRNREPFTVAYLDLDNFKRINDDLGHDAGDRLLRTIGEALRVAVRDSDAVARLGGDEFALLLPYTDSAGAELLMSKLWAGLARVLAGTETGCSVGVVTFQQAPASPHLVLRTADRLMYEVKSRGKNAIAYRCVDVLEEPG